MQTQTLQGSVRCCGAADVAAIVEEGGEHPPAADNISSSIISKMGSRRDLGSV
jgi:hypothetical protein